MDDRADEQRLGPASAAVTATLEAARGDARPKMPEPPPVRLMSVRDVRLPMVAGLERAMDGFYRDLLRFERVEVGADRGEGPVYRAENHDLRLDVVEVPPEDQVSRPLGVISPHYGEILEWLAEARIEFERVRGLSAGDDGVLLQDPSGNWVALSPLREFR